MKSASTNLLDQIVEPIARNMNPDTASEILGIRATRSAVRRMAVLARKCNEGEMTPEEHAEYQSNVMASEFLALLQARARALLATRKKR